MHGELMMCIAAQAFVGWKYEVLHGTEKLQCNLNVNPHKAWCETVPTRIAPSVFLENNL